MSRHEGVTCDCCLNGNFKGKRFKCLLCYDYDLCSNCYDAGLVTGRHSVGHPMQCIITRNDIELYFGGETGNDQHQSFTCPYCDKLGFSLSSLIEHISSEHSGSDTIEVICPVCATSPVNCPNNVRQDLLGHLTQEHRCPSRELTAIFDEPSSRQIARRLPPPPARSGRGRRPHVHFGSSGTLAALASSRESSDPIAEFFSQLSNVGRPYSTTTTLPPSVPDRQLRSRVLDRNVKLTSLSENEVSHVNFFETSSNTTVHHPAHSQMLLPKILSTPQTEEEKKNESKIKIKRRELAKLVILSTLITP